MTRWMARATGRPEDALHLSLPLSATGIDSLGAATLLWDLEAWLGVTVPITIATGDPTLGELCERIAAHAREATR
jgi:acyl carrier protein